MPTDPLTSPLDEITLDRLGRDWTLVLTRRIAHPRERVWKALTERDSLAQWAPFTSDRGLDHTGPADLTERDTADATPTEIEILEVDRQAVLEYTWGTDVLRWELTDEAGGTRLILRHRFAERGDAASYAAGWHLCLDALVSLLAGSPTPSVVGSGARASGWQELYDRYQPVLASPGRAHRRAARGPGMEA